MSAKERVGGRLVDQAGLGGNKIKNELWPLKLTLIGAHSVPILRNITSMSSVVHYWTFRTATVRLHIQCPCLYLWVRSPQNWLANDASTLNPPPLPTYQMQTRPPQTPGPLRGAAECLLHPLRRSFSFFSFLLGLINHLVPSLRLKLGRGGEKASNEVLFNLHSREPPFETALAVCSSPGDGRRFSGVHPNLLRVAPSST